MNKRAILTAEQAIYSKQKRYLTEASIITAIDTARAKQKATEAMAANFMEAHKAQNVGLLSVDSSRYLIKCIEYSGFETKDYRGISEELYAKAERMEERIKALGHKLAAFRTELLSFTNDRAVV